MPDEQKRIEKLFKEGKASLTVPEDAAESMKDILPSDSLFLGYCLNDDGAFPWCVWVFYLQNKMLVGVYAQGEFNGKAGAARWWMRDVIASDEWTDKCYVNSGSWFGGIGTIMANSDGIGVRPAAWVRRDALHATHKE